MANQIVVSAGAKVRNLDGVLTATSGVVSSLPIDGSLGIPQLDINGKILVSQLPNSVMEYKGTWNVSTNTPTLVNGVGNQGDVYLVEGAAVGGTAFNFGAGPITFFNGDQAIYSGSIWQRASGATGTVTSVAITESGDSLNITGSPITTSGTINIGFNGTNLQYVNGAGNLTTFPTLTGYVPYTGATANVDLGVYDLTADLITGARGSFASNGGSDTFAINHSSGGGIALNITKGGNGEGLYINKTSGSGNAATIIGTLEATTLVKSGGTSSQFLKADGTVDSNIYALDSLVVHLAGTETITGAKTFSGYTTFTSTVDITSGLTFSNSGFTLVLQPPTLSVNRTVTLPNGTGTLALTSDISYPVTSVFGRTGAVVAAEGDYSLTQLSDVTITSPTTSQLLQYNGTSWVNWTPNYITGNQTITLSGDVSGSGTTAITTTIGALKVTNAMLAGSIDLTTKVTGLLPDGNISSAATWNAKQNAITLTTTGTSGAATLVGATLNIPQYTDAYTGTVTSVAALTIGTTGTDLSSSVANSTTTPVITLNVPTASATNRGVLASSDWSTFNNKQSALTNPVTGTGTTNYLPKFTGTSTIGNSQIFDNGTNVGVGTASPNASYRATISGAASGVIGGLAIVDTDGASYSIYSATNNLIVRDVTNSATRLTLSTSGNLGLGVTPSAWNTVTAFQVGSTSLGAYSNTGYVNSNAFFQSSWKYVNSSFAARYEINSSDAGIHAWFTAPSGTAGNAITFTQAMTLTAAGYLGIGTPTPALKFVISNGGGQGLEFDPIGYGASIALIQSYNRTTSAYGSIQFDALSFRFGNGGTERMRIWETTGNVNIGTTPASDSGYKLDVNGTGRFSGSSGTPVTLAISTANSNCDVTMQSSNSSSVSRIRNGTNDLQFHTNGTLALTLASNQAATFSNYVASAVGVSGSPNTINQFILSNAGYRNSNTTISADTSTLSYYFLNYNDSSAVLYDRTLDIRVRGTADGTYGAGIIRFFANNYTSGSTETEIMNIKGTGVVKIISTTASSSGTTGALVVGGGVGVGGSVYASSFFETSDMRIKTLIQDNYQTKGIESITPKLYTKNGKVELGYYAQDFVGVLDSAVSKGSDDMLSLSYREVHTAKIYALEQEIKELKAKMN